MKLKKLHEGFYDRRGWVGDEPPDPPTVEKDEDIPVLRQHFVELSKWLHERMPEPDDPWEVYDGEGYPLPQQSPEVYLWNVVNRALSGNETAMKEMRRDPPNVRSKLGKHIMTWYHLAMDLRL